MQQRRGAEECPCRDCLRRARCLPEAKPCAKLRGWAGRELAAARRGARVLRREATA